MPSIQIDSDRLDEIASLLSLWESRGATYRNTLSEVIGFKREDPRSDFATQFRAYLTKVTSAQAPGFDFEKGDELPDSMKKEHTQKIGSVPLEIWTATKAGNFGGATMCKFMRDSGWDFVDHRKIKSPLLKPPEEVKELLNEQIIDDRKYEDLSPALRGLLELIVKAFLNWWETTQEPQPKKFGEL